MNQWSVQLTEQSKDHWMDDVMQVNKRCKLIDYYVQCFLVLFFFPSIFNNDITQFQHVSSHSSAHISWSYTKSVQTHNYCHKFGTRVDTSHHVWRMSELAVGKVGIWATKTSQNHCTGVWWANTHLAFLFLFWIVSHVSLLAYKHWDVFCPNYRYIVIS